MMVTAKANEQVTIEQIGGSLTMAGFLWTQAVAERARLSDENASLTARLAAVEALERDYQEVRDRLDAANARLADAETLLRDSEARNRTSLEVISAREQHVESQRVEIERLQKALIPSWYWDDRDLESAIPADEVGEFDDVGDIIQLRPIVELPTVFALVTEDGVEFYDSFDAANESEPNEAAKGE